MNPRRVRAKRTGREGWRYRFVDPVTKLRERKVFWFEDKAAARRAFLSHLEQREQVASGLPDNTGWRIPYKKLVGRFLVEAPITSAERRANLKRWLERNPLEVVVAAELAHLGKLTAKCTKLVSEHGDHWTIATVQKPLKQLSRWAAAVGILPHDPLAAWKLIEFSGYKRRRRAFMPDEIEAVFEAAAELDGLFGRAVPSVPLFKALLVTGNRPSAVFCAKVKDLRDGRIVLPYGNKRKRNGMATIPAEFERELRDYLKQRSHPGPEAALFVSHRGEELDRINLREDFKRAMILAFVRMEWPHANPLAVEADPAEVAYLIEMDKLRGASGPRPKDPTKIAARQRQDFVTETVAVQIGPKVKARLEGRDLYALRKTHISWARRITNADSVKSQTGHAPQDVEERHYLDLVNPRESSQAVWEVLTGVRLLSGERVEAVETRMAVGAESVAFENQGQNLATIPTKRSNEGAHDPASKGIQAIKGVEFTKKSGRRDSNPRPLPPQGSALPNCATPRFSGTGGEKLAGLNFEVAGTRLSATATVR